MTLLLAQGLVVALTHIVGHRFIEKLLQVMTAFPSHRDHLCPPRFKERLAIGINGLALFGANNILGHPLAGDTVQVWEGVGIQQIHQAMKGIGLALVRSSRKEQHIGCGLRQPLAEFVTGDLISAATQAMRFIHHYQVPTGGNQILEPAAVVVGNALGGPTSPLIHRLD